MPSLSWIPGTLTDMLQHDSNLLLMLTTQLGNQCPGKLVKPKRDDPAFTGRLFTHCQLQDAVLQSVPL